MTSSAIQQTVTGDHNIFTATGDVNITYHLPPAQAADHHNLNILLDRVNAFWVDGVLEHSVASEIAHELLKSHVADAVEHPWESVLELPGQDARVLERTDPVKPIYDQVGRSMLILGEPGSGKTITLLELARDLVHAARTDPSQPVPVVLNLSTWAGQPMQRWLIDELKTKYFIAERMGRPLLEKNRLALLLDGLDEVAVDKQAACVEAINAFTESYGVPGLVVSSRVGEYTALPVRLKLHGAILLEALTREQIDGYLSALGSDLASLRAALEKDEALVKLAQSPLMLSVMSVAYRGRKFEASDDGDESLTDARRAQIFDAYVEQMFARKGSDAAGERRSEEERGLSNLAQRMREHNQTVFTIEGLQPSWLPGASQRFIYAIQSRLVPGIILGAAEGIYLGGTGLMGNPFAVELVLGLLLGIAFGIGAGLFDWVRMELSMKSAKKARRTSIVLVAMCLLAYFLIFAVPFTLLWGEDAPIRVAFGIVWAVLFAARVRMPAARTDIRAVEALAWSWRRAAKGFAAGFGVGLVFSVGMLVAFKETFLTGDPRPWTYPIVGPFVYANLGAIIGGIATTTMESKTTPNQGMRLSLRNARFGGLLIWCTTFVGTIPYVIGPPLYFADAMPPWAGVIGFSLLVSLYFGILAALWFGGLDFVYHWTLRRRLSAAGVLPRGLPSFLEQMSRLAFVQRVGGGYIFLHRLLLEHFADRSTLGAATPRARGA